MTARKWVFRLFGAAAAIFLVYFMVNFRPLYERVKLDRSYPGLSRYVFERTPDIAIVGSSLAYRLYEGYFNTPLRNISIGGGSPATGLAIVASYPSLPKIILVETNILSRPIDQNLIDAFGSNPSEPYQWFKPVRAVISWTYYWIKYKSEAENVRRLPLLPPETYDIKNEMNAIIAAYAGKNWDAIMRPHVRELARQIHDLERCGTRVLLFELPSPPELRDDNYVRTAHRLARDAFPDDRQWVPLSDEELRWDNTSHMDPRSAILVARQIDRYLSVGINDRGKRK